MPSLIKPARVRDEKSIQDKSVKEFPFGEHSSGQDKDELARTLKINGKVNRIFDTINAAHVLMDADEAERLKKHPHVLSVTPDLMMETDTVQSTPGWALDRLDQTSTSLNYQYIYNASGLGQTIYILDSGMNLSVPAVAAEFGGRASVFWDVNPGGTGADCNGHGTMVASAAAGSTYGTAKQAKLVVAKITNGCTGNSEISTAITAFNWLATNAPRGTIVNYSHGLLARNSAGQVVCGSAINLPLEASIRTAYNNGIIVVIAAGNDGCNVNNYSPTRIPEAFVVGATNSLRFNFQQDARASFSRFGSNVAGFAPGQSVNVMNQNGTLAVVNGTSFSAPYVAGIFAAGCQAAGTLCSTMANAGVAYTALKNAVSTGSVVNDNGTPLPTGTPSRFMNRLPW